MRLALGAPLSRLLRFMLIETGRSRDPARQESGRAAGAGRPHRSWREIGVGGLDPSTFLAVPCALAVVAIVASWLPARRAARIDAMMALRGE
jgi:ABC-type antimicrobial peptide transport system permease subunit